ncbi:arylsulfatase [Phlyctema vagabunda]|uniref:Arylsulfatase n=1 Tax=Phlyctema vagabunda TaxID=108571 RepID=A0ABR4PBP1_9HELO
MARGILSTALLVASITGAYAATPPVQEPLGNLDDAVINAKPRPNIVFVLTDDQDVHLSSLEYMPYVQKHLIEKGTYFNKHYCTTAVCCPSRVTLWTGKAAHNTNITDVNPPYGGYPKFIAEGFHKKYLPVWLQEAGYNTYYTGKLFNVHTIDNYNTPYPAGFTGTDFLLDPYTYNYMNSSFQRDQEEPRSYEGEYVTDVLAQNAFRLLDNAVEAEKPFFLTVAPIAPHGNIFMNGTALDENVTFEHGAPVSAKRHEHLFKGLKVPRTSHFNPSESSGANWIRNLPQQNQSNIDYNDHFYRARLRSLQAVDELVDQLIDRLDKHGILGHTYVIYSSDNGFHIGQHRLQPGKSCGIEEDINIPLVIRGPGVTPNVSTEMVTTHTDLAPTFLELLGIPQRPDFDGAAFPITQRGIEGALQNRREHVNVEYWGWAGSEGIHNYTLSEMNNTYKGLRIIGEGYNLYYSIWCNNEHELYDMDSDPYQLDNLLLKRADTDSGLSRSTVLGLPISKVVARLDSLLFVLKSCKSDTCVTPWRSLHPKGDVLTLNDALSIHYDSLYEVEQKKVIFNRCERGYIVDAEGPQFENEGVMFRGGLPWDNWV